MRISFCVILFFQYIILVYAEESIEVKHANSKYVTDLEVVLAQGKKVGHYVANCTVTTLQAWDNNVTMSGTYTLMNGNHFDLEFKVCDVLKHQWMVDALKSFSNVKLQCPFPAGTYTFINAEFPPKNFPLALPKGDYHVNLRVFITNTKEPISELDMKMHLV